MPCGRSKGHANRRLRVRGSLSSLFPGAVFAVDASSSATVDSTPLGGGGSGTDQRQLGDATIGTAAASPAAAVRNAPIDRFGGLMPVPIHMHYRTTGM